MLARQYDVIVGTSDHLYGDIVDLPHGGRARVWTNAYEACLDECI